MPGGERGIIKSGSFRFGRGDLPRHSHVVGDDAPQCRDALDGRPIREAVVVVPTLTSVPVSYKEPMPRAVELVHRAT